MTARASVELERELRRQLAAGELDLPNPAGGRTSERLHRLADFGRSDLQVARLVEAHTDAVAILHEAERTPRPGALYGVWAAEDPSCALALAAAPGRAGGLALNGTKAFCTGATIVDRALVTVGRDGVIVLVDVDLRHDGVRFDTTSWLAPAFHATVTAVATFAGVEVAQTDIVGPPGWYLDRVGFWHGACGPAACWAGGAIGLIDDAITTARDKPANPHLDAHLGALAALRWQMDAVIEGAGRDIDLRPADAATAMPRALVVRHNVERAATAAVDLYGRALGPRPFIQEPAVIRRVSELQLYIRQHHAERDLEAVGRAVRGGSAPWRGGAD